MCYRPRYSGGRDVFRFGKGISVLARGSCIGQGCIEGLYLFRQKGRGMGLYSVGKRSRDRGRRAGFGLTNEEKYRGFILFGKWGRRRRRGRACIFTFLLDKWGRGAEEGPYLVWKIG
jgi:hypothetical protein